MNSKSAQTSTSTLLIMNVDDPKPLYNRSWKLAPEGPEIIYPWSDQDARISRSRAGAFIRVEPDRARIIKLLMDALLCTRIVINWHKADESRERENPHGWWSIAKQDGVNQESTKSNREERACFGGSSLTNSRGNS